MNIAPGQAVSWSKNGIIAYGDPDSPEGNLSVTFLETINGVNWRFHPPMRYIIHPQLHETTSDSTKTVDNRTSNSTHNTPTGGITSNSSTTPGSNLNAIPKTNSALNANSKSNTAPHFFYNISSVHWNNWLSLPGDMLAVCDEIGNMTMLISGQSPEGATTFEKLTMLFQDNVYKIYNQVISLTPNVTKPKKLERKRTKKEYHTTILDFHWISSSKNVIISQFCALDTTINTYRNKAQQIPPYGVFHPPFMKYACIALRKNGQVDFWYQFSNSKDHKKITLQLSTSPSTRNKELDWLEFAKVIPIDDGQCVLITTYSKLNNKLSFYKLYVNWNSNTTRPKTLSDPTLRIQNILNSSIDETDNQGNVLNLTNMHIVSKISSEKDHYPEIILVYDICGTSKTLVRKMRLIYTYLSMDYMTIFKPELQNQEKKIPLKTDRYNVRYYNDIELEGKVTHVTSEMLDSFISFYFENGSIASYNLNDWELETHRLVNQVKQGKFTNIITSVLSAGLKFPKLPSSSAIEWIQVSPTMSGVILKLCKEDIPKFYAICREDLSDPNRDSVDATAFAFTFVGSTHRQLSAEDLSIACKSHVMRLAELDEERAKRFIMTLMINLYPFFNVSLDAPKDIMEKMISSRPIQKIMLLQLELGSGFKSTEHISEMARIILYLKNVLFAFNGVARNLQFAIEQMNNNNNNNSSNGNNNNSTNSSNMTKLFQTAFSKQDLIHSLIPIAKWFVKFVTYLMQEVLILVNNPAEGESNLVLGVFGSKMSRQLILSIMNEIKKIAQFIAKFPEHTYPVLNESSHYLKMVLGESPVNFEKFETFLTNVNNKFTTVSEEQSSVKNKEHLIAREHSLLIKAELPREDIKVGEFLVTYSNNTLVSHVNAADVYFADTTGLRTSQKEYFVPELRHLLQPLSDGLVIDDQENILGPLQSSRDLSQLMYDGVTFDRLSKQELASGKLKRCSRCGCVTRAGYVVSSDKTVVPTSIQTKRWPTMYTRTCICSGVLYELDM